MMAGPPTFLRVKRKLGDVLEENLRALSCTCALLFKYVT